MISGFLGHVPNSAASPAVTQQDPIPDVGVLTAPLVPRGHLPTWEPSAPASRVLWAWRAAPADREGSMGGGPPPPWGGEPADEWAGGSGHVGSEPGQPGSVPRSGQDPVGGHSHVARKVGCCSLTLHVRPRSPWSGITRPHPRSPLCDVALACPTASARPGWRTCLLAQVLWAPGYLPAPGGSQQVLPGQRVWGRQAPVRQALRKR